MIEPNDSNILSAVREWGNNSMTYVVVNRLRMDGFYVPDTAKIRRSLERMEKDGRVKRVPTSYTRQICWSAI